MGEGPAHQMEGRDVSTDKRARKKQARDERVAQQWAAYRRRRYIRIGGAAVALVALVGLALFAGGEDAEDESRGENNPAAQPSPPEEESSAPPEEEVPVDVACGGEEPPQAAPKQYKKPEQVLVKGTDYSAVFNTSCGEIVVDLLEEETPKTVNNFVFLANEGYFNGLSFHRIEQNFVIQSGDPDGQNGTPPDGPGYEIPDELPKKPNQYKFGTLAMANSGPNTGGS